MESMSGKLFISIKKDTSNLFGRSTNTEKTEIEDEYQCRRGRNIGTRSDLGYRHRMDRKHTTGSNEI
jgi:hypothetical protein